MINDFKKGYQPRTNVEKDEIGNLVADSYSSVARWRNYFSHLLHVHVIIDVRQREIHTSEKLLPKLRTVDVELTIENQVFIKS